MRLMVVDVPRAALGRMLGWPASLDALRSVKLVSYVRTDAKEVATIWRVNFPGRPSKLEALFPRNRTRVRVLERTPDGEYILFVRQRPGGRPAGIQDLLAKAGAHVVLPYEINEETVRLTYLGTGVQLRRVVANLRREGVEARILSVTEARFGLDSPLTRLTSKQRQVVLTAFDSGYYEIPRRVGSRQLATKLRIRAGTLVAHRRKAEARIMTAVILGH